MKFFVPYTESREEADIVFSGIKCAAVEAIGASVKVAKIARLHYSRDGKQIVAEVGRTETGTGEPVIAILEAPTAFFVCTPSRGVVEGTPIHVERELVIAFARFDED